METRDGPDLFVACRWDNHPNKFGVPGAIASDIGHTAGQGTHTTLSPFDMHNTLIAAGPDFRQGWTDKSPTANIDIAPTILSIVGIDSKTPMDGRVLAEAFTDGGAAPAPNDRQLVAENNGWRQILRLTTVGKTTYVLDGNSTRGSRSR
jgi:arylsulfatase A-like enzyme